MLALLYVQRLDVAVYAVVGEVQCLESLAAPESVRDPLKAVAADLVALGMEWCGIDWNGTE